MYRVRLWSVRHARGLNRVYRLLEDILTALRPMLRRIGDGVVEGDYPAEALQATLAAHFEARA